jgi:hypothetical protein
MNRRECRTAFGEVLEPDAPAAFCSLRSEAAVTAWIGTNQTPQCDIQALQSISGKKVYEGV